MKQTSLEIFVILQVEMHVLVPITIIYILMFVTGVLGNAAVCFVIVHNKSMHTATNYYLFSLAISDLIILLLGKKKILFPLTICVCCIYSKVERLFGKRRSKGGTWNRFKDRPSRLRHLFGEDGKLIEWKSCEKETICWDSIIKVPIFMKI